MGTAFVIENVPTITRGSSSSLLIVTANNGRPTHISIGGQSYTPASSLTLNTGTVGALGLDTGTLTANTLYYVYAIVNQSSLAMSIVASLNGPTSGPTMPSGYGTAYKVIGTFLTDATPSVLIVSGYSGFPGTFAIAPASGSTGSNPSWDIPGSINIAALTASFQMNSTGGGGVEQRFLRSGSSKWAIGVNDAATSGGFYFYDYVANTYVGSISPVGLSGHSGQWKIGPGSESNAQSTASLVSRANTGNNFGNCIEWGHPNGAGYGSVLAFNTGGGTPFIGFSLESGTNANTYRTRGFQGIGISGGTGGGIAFFTVASANADNQSNTQLFTVDLSGNGSFTKSLTVNQEYMNSAGVGAVGSGSNFSISAVFDHYFGWVQIQASDNGGSGAANTTVQFISFSRVSTGGSSNSAVISTYNIGSGHTFSLAFNSGAIVVTNTSGNSGNFNYIVHIMGGN